MAISINWATKVISVPQSFLTPLGGSLYELDTNAFRLALKDLEDDPVGIMYDDTHRHNTTVLLGGIEYARTLEIINGYTVTFEDGQYAVNLVGSNNNIADVTNVNQVSIRPSNSAGLIQTREIQYSSFEGAIHIDVLNGTPGVEYPVGTPRKPVSNVQDALFIANLYGFSTLHIIGDITFTTGDDISDFLILGQNAARSLIIVESGANVYRCEFREASITGVLDGSSILRYAYAFDLDYVSGFVYETALAGDISLVSGASAYFFSCYSDTNAVTVDCAGSGATLSMQGCRGDIHIANKTGTDKCEIYVAPGNVVLEASVTNGTGIEIAGVGSLTNLSSVVPEESNIVDGATVDIIQAILRNKTVTNPATGLMTVYEADGITPKYAAQLYEDAAGNQAYRGQGAERRERLS